MLGRKLRFLLVVLVPAAVVVLVWLPGYGVPDVHYLDTRLLHSPDLGILRRHGRPRTTWIERQILSSLTK